MLLRGLARRVQAARPQRRILTDQAPQHLRPAFGTAVLEDAGVEVGAGARQRVDRSVFGAVVAALAVDDHRRCQHQPSAARGEHLGEQHRGAVVVVTPVRRRVGRIDPGPDHRGLMAHHVDALQQWRQRGRIADIEHLAIGRRFGAGAVRGGKHRVDGDDVVPRIAQPAPTRAPMKPAAPVSRTLTAGRTEVDAFVGQAVRAGID